jgi:hypothetical protein
MKNIQDEIEYDVINNFNPFEVVLSDREQKLIILYRGEKEDIINYIKNTFHTENLHIVESTNDDDIIKIIIQDIVCFGSDIEDAFRVLMSESNSKGRGVTTRPRNNPISTHADYFLNDIKCKTVEELIKLISSKNNSSTNLLILQ